MSIEIDPEEPLPPRADLYAALAFIVFGGAIAVGSWRMDRLAHLNINQYEIPGLVPGLLGATLDSEAVKKLIEEQLRHCRGCFDH